MNSGAGGSYSSSYAIVAAPSPGVSYPSSYDVDSVSGSGLRYDSGFELRVSSSLNVVYSGSGLVSVERDPPVLVVRGLNGRLFTGVYLHGYLEWIPLPGATASFADVARCGGRVYIAVRGLNNQIFIGYLNATTLEFSEWVRVPGATPSAPSIAAEPDCSRIYIIVRGLNNRIYYTYVYSNLTWSGAWYQLPGATDAAPSAAVANGTLYVAVKGLGSTRLFLWTGSSWVRLPGASDQPPDIASDGSIIMVVVRGFDNRIYIGYWLGTLFDGWYRMSGLTKYRPSIAYTSAWYISVIGLNGRPFIMRLDKGIWVQLPGATDNPVAIG